MNMTRMGLWALGVFLSGCAGSGSEVRCSGHLERINPLSVATPLATPVGAVPVVPNPNVVRKSP
jgi:hypothetical protein